MIRDCIDAYKELLETVTGIETVIPFMRISVNQGEAKTIYGDGEAKDINTVLVNYSKVTKYEDESSETMYNPITLQCTLVQSFVDSADYTGSTQETFDTVLDALSVEFGIQQDYVYGGVVYNIGDIKEFNIQGESGIADFLGKPCHCVKWEQEVWKYE